MHKGFQITGGPSSRLEEKKLKKKKLRRRSSDLKQFDCLVHG